MKEHFYLRFIFNSFLLIQELLINSNINYLKKHRADEKILDRLHELSFSIEMYFNFFKKTQTESLTLIQNHILPFISNLSQIENEINIVWSLSNVPIFEMKTKNIINQLLTFGIGSLNCSIISALTQVILSSNSVQFLKAKERQILETVADNKMDSLLNHIAEKGLEICNKILDIFQKNVSFLVYSNTCTLASFNLVQGLSTIFVLLGVGNTCDMTDEEHLLKTVCQKLQHGLVYSHIKQVFIYVIKLDIIYTSKNDNKFSD